MSKVLIQGLTLILHSGLTLILLILLILHRADPDSSQGLTLILHYAWEVKSPPEGNRVLLPIPRSLLYLTGARLKPVIRSSEI